LIIDAQGVIAYKGHPNLNANLESDIDNLLKGQPMTISQQSADQLDGDRDNNDDFGENIDVR